MIHSAMLMTAGLGTRLQPYTLKVSKPLLPLMGVPMAQFALDALGAARVDHVVANVHHLAELTRAGLEGLEVASRARLEISDESRELLGSGGGIRQALPAFAGQPFFYANADVLCPVDWAALAKRHAELRAHLGVVMTLAVFEQGPPGGRYREIHLDASRERVVGLGELAEQKPFFVGAAVLEPEAFLHLTPGRPADFVADVLRGEVAKGRVGVFSGQGPWMDIGSPALWHEAHLQLALGLERGTLPELWARRISSCKGAGMRIDLARRLVLYGDADGQGLRDGILFNGIWTACPEARASSGRA